MLLAGLGKSLATLAGCSSQGRISCLEIPIGARYTENGCRRIPIRLLEYREHYHPMMPNCTSQRGGLQNLVR